MNTRRALPFAVVTILIVLMTAASWAQQAANAPVAKTAKAAKNPVQEIELPQYPPELPAGPNKEVFEQHCLLCHSARYVTMQPQFPKAVWEKDVKKMVDAYGAPISAAEQQQIVEYLVAIKGPAAGK